jgi:hypothetical protein
MKNNWALTPIVFLPIVFLVACAAVPENDAFKQVMQRQVGKSADDTDFYPTLYKLKQTNSTRLPNGNTREEYAAGRNGKCKLSFETTPGARRVVGWASEGDRDECVILRRDR